MTMVKNRPTPEGYALGKELARLADKADAEQRKQFPDMKERCASCAFREGTFPNGCVETVMDALKCVMEHVPFYCHEVKGDSKPYCVGWFTSFAAIGNKQEPQKMPWKFSHDYTTDKEEA